MEMMTRVQCKRCKGAKGWIFEGSHGRESYVNCPCTEKLNPAGPGFEVLWVDPNTCGS